MSKKRVRSDGRLKNKPLVVRPTNDLRRAPTSSGASDRDAIVAAKSATGATEDAVTTAADRPTKPPTDGRGRVTGADIARRAYLLYLERGCEHGHDVEDWLQAERDLQTGVGSAKQ
jgi:hypothetical protein